MLRSRTAHSASGEPKWSPCSIWRSKKRCSHTLLTGELGKCPQTNDQCFLHYFDDWAQDCSDSSANVLELPQSSTKPLILLPASFDVFFFCRCQRILTMTCPFAQKRVWPHNTTAVPSAGHPLPSVSSPFHRCWMWQSLTTSWKTLNSPPPHPTPPHPNFMSPRVAFWFLNPCITILAL